MITKMVVIGIVMTTLNSYKVVITTTFIHGCHDHHGPTHKVVFTLSLVSVSQVSLQGCYTCYKFVDNLGFFSMGKTS